MEGKTQQHAVHTSNYTFKAQGHVLVVIGVARSCFVEMYSPVHDTASEEVLRELSMEPGPVALPPQPSQEYTQDWDDDAAMEAIDQVSRLRAAAGPQRAQINGDDDLLGPTQMWAQPDAPEPASTLPLQRGRPSARQDGSVRRRIRHKQPAPRAYQDKHTVPMEAMLTEALAAEQDDEPGVLPTTVKRKHMHWTFVRTFEKGYKQPTQFTRKEMWRHVSKCYREVYPDETSPTGSILQFGLVANEQHKGAAKEADRDLHKHCACFCSSQHYWNKIAKHSLQKYGVPLNAVAHDSYITMYAYLRQPSRKKPLQEIDAEPCLSESHPRGADLVELLSASRKGAALAASRAVGGKAAQKRKRLSIFEEVKQHEIRNVKALRAHACREFKAGNTALAEYCTRQGAKLEDVLRSAWSVLDAPAELEGQNKSLMDKLVHASRELPCECGGRWTEGAEDILARNHIDRHFFCQAMLRALRISAKRGSNVACIGEGGCGLGVPQVIRYTAYRVTVPPFMEYRTTASCVLLPMAYRVLAHASTASPRSEHRLYRAAASI